MKITVSEFAEFSIRARGMAGDPASVGPALAALAQVIRVLQEIVEGDLHDQMIHASIELAASRLCVIGEELERILAIQLSTPA